MGSRIPEISSGPNFARGAEGSFVLQAGVSSKVGSSYSGFQQGWRQIQLSVRKENTDLLKYYK